MRNEDSGAFAKIMVYLAELYDKPFSETQLEMYWRLLKNYSLTNIRQAAHNHVTDPIQGRFMPKPADFVLQLQQLWETQAEEAWSKVEGAISRYGRYSSVAFDDGLIHSAILKMGGWPRLCSHQRQDYPATITQFKKYYIHSLKFKTEHLPCYLRGINSSDDIIKVDNQRQVELINKKIKE